jgi:hypothetical protein
MTTFQIDETRVSLLPPESRGAEPQPDTNEAPDNKTAALEAVLPVKLISQPASQVRVGEPVEPSDGPLPHDDLDDACIPECDFAVTVDRP